MRDKVSAIAAGLGREIEFVELTEEQARAAWAAEGLPPEVINRRGLAKTFQITNIFPEVSVFENVQVAAQSRTAVSGRLPSLWRRPRVDDAVMELLESEKLAELPPEVVTSMALSVPPSMFSPWMSTFVTAFWMRIVACAPGYEPGANR